MKHTATTTTKPNELKMEEQIVSVNIECTYVCLRHSFGARTNMWNTQLSFVRMSVCVSVCVEMSMRIDSIHMEHELRPIFGGIQCVVYVWSQKRIMNSMMMIHAVHWTEISTYGYKHCQSVRHSYSEKRHCVLMNVGTVQWEFNHNQFYSIILKKSNQMSENRLFFD